MSDSERVAVLEAELNRNKKDIARLYKFFRDHMEKEELMNDKFLECISDINSKLSSQKSFWAGMIFAFTGVGALIGSIITYMKH